MESTDGFGGIESGSAVIGDATAPAAARPAPVATAERIESLDVLRGFALLGILLLNILGFGLYSAGYFDPLVGTGANPTLNLAVWGTVDVLFEGAMRTLFSMLFGAGVVMFATGLGSRSGTGKSAALHYRRTLWLLLFGAFDAFVLLWTGDILMVYAMAGALLYPLRNLSARALIVLASVLLVLMSAYYAGTRLVMGQARQAAEQLTAQPGVEQPAGVRELAAVWQDFAADFATDEAAVDEELSQRRAAYLQVAAFSASYMIEQLQFVVPVYLLWDALAMMLLGMACYRLGLMSGQRSAGFYSRLMISGFAIGLLTNGYEVLRAVGNGFDILQTFSYFQWTYHVGRLGMALGWLSLVMLICQKRLLNGLRFRLAAVGRMALSNYLLHSVVCLFIFTGAGLGLVGELERWMLYPIVLLIWVLQLYLSPWWLERFAFGPAEWLWRSLTYGARQRFLASD